MSTRKRELGRGERVVPGVWRLRLPLPWPGVPHCNAWAVAAGDGVVLFDCGMHEPGSFAHLERALDMVGLQGAEPVVGARAAVGVDRRSELLVEYLVGRAQDAPFGGGGVVG